MDWRVPLSDLKFGVEELKAVADVLQSGWLTMGAITNAFEEDFAKFTGARHALAMTNATAALHLACLALGLGTGDEVVVPSLTFVASANAIRYTGATPIFADVVGEHDLNISLQAIRNAISPRTKAIMVVHYGGYACDMSGILDLAKEHQLFVIEDAAHAVGSWLHEMHLGTFGDVGCFSFFPNKNMTTAEGGMLVTDNEQIAEKARIMRSHGMTSLTWDRHQGHAWSYDVTELGYNYRIDEMRSALGRVQLAKIPANNLRRQVLTNLYRELLSKQAPSVGIPFMNHPGISACHIMPVVLPKDTDRLRFMDAMKAHGIQTSIHYPPIHLFSAFKTEKDWSFLLPMTEEIASREVTLPLYPGMIDEQVHWVVDAVQQCLGHLS